MTQPAEFVEPSSWHLEILSLRQITPAVRAIRAHLRPSNGDDALPLAYAPGQDLALTLATPDGVTVKRRYTIGGYDAATGMLDLEVVVHGDGPGARWLAAASPGDTVEAFGPRGKITLVPDMLTYVYVGDEASLPAIAALTAAQAPGSTARLVIDVAGPEEHRKPPAPVGVAVDVVWLDRAGEAADSPERVLRALDAIELAPEPCHAYVFGEMHVVAAARARLAQQLSRESISPKSYWRSDLANLGHGEPSRDE